MILNSIFYDIRKQCNTEMCNYICKIYAKDYFKIKRLFYLNKSQTNKAKYFLGQITNLKGK